MHCALSVSVWICICRMMISCLQHLLEFFSRESDSTIANVCPSSLSVIETPQPLRNAPTGQQAYWPSSLSTYWPLSLMTIEPIDHWVYQPMILVTIKPMFFFCDFYAFWLINLSMYLSVIKLLKPWVYWVKLVELTTTCKTKWFNWIPKYFL